MDELNDLPDLSDLAIKPKKRQSGDSTVASVIDDELTKLGWSDNARLSFLGDVGRENAWNRKTIFGGHVDPASYTNGRGKIENRGIISWNAERKTNLDNFLKKEGVLGRGDDDELRAMVRFADYEMQNNDEWKNIHKKMRDPNISTYDASENLRKYIKYVPDGKYNSYDSEFRVKNNAIWANKAKKLGLGQLPDLSDLANTSADNTENLPDLSDLALPIKSEPTSQSPQVAQNVPSDIVNTAFSPEETADIQLAEANKAKLPKERINNSLALQLGKLQPDKNYAEYLSFTEQKDSPDARAKYDAALKTNPELSVEASASVNSPVQPSGAAQVNNQLTQPKTVTTFSSNPNIADNNLRAVTGISEGSKVYKQKPTAEQVVFDAIKNTYGEQAFGAEEAYRKLTGKTLFEPYDKNAIQRDIDENWNPKTGVYDNVRGQVAPRIQQLVSAYADGGEEGLKQELSLQNELAQSTGFARERQESAENALKKELLQSEIERRDPTTAKGVFNLLTENPMSRLVDVYDSLKGTLGENIAKEIQGAADEKFNNYVSQYGSAEKAIERRRELGEMPLLAKVAQNAGQFAQGAVVENIAPLMEGAGLLSNAVDRYVLGNDTKAKDTLGMVAGRSMRDAFRRGFGDADESTLNELSKGFGQVLGQMLGFGRAAQAANLGTKGIYALGAGAGLLQQSSAAYNEALSKGASEDQANLAAFIAAPGGLIEGATDALVLGKLKKLDALTENGFSKSLRQTVVKVVKDAAEAGASEMLFEEFPQNLMSNAAARIAYSKDPVTFRAVIDDIDKSLRDSQNAFILGAAAGGGASAASNLNAALNSPETVENNIQNPPVSESADLSQPTENTTVAPENKQASEKPKPGFEIRRDSRLSELGYAPEEIAAMTGVEKQEIYDLNKTQNTPLIQKDERNILNETEAIQEPPPVEAENVLPASETKTQSKVLNDNPQQIKSADIPELVSADSSVLPANRDDVSESSETPINRQEENGQNQPGNVSPPVNLPPPRRDRLRLKPKQGQITPPNASQLPEQTAINTPPKQSVYTERGTKAEIEPKVIDASDLLTSLDEGYPQELQPRDRTRTASKAQISEIANKINPEFLGDSAKASDGRPLVVPVQVDGKTKYAVVSGNGRSEGIRTAYRTNNEGARKYAEFARSKGGTSQQPVYVGVLDNSINLAEFAREANESATAQMSATEQARTDAERLDSSVLNQFVASEDGTINNAANRDFIRSFMERAVGTAEQGRFLTSEGSLNQDGVNRVRNAIFAVAFGDSDVGMNAIQRMSESTDNNVKNITSALLSKSGRLAELKQQAKDGARYPEFDISGDLAKAMEKYAALRDSGSSVDEYLSQGALFGADTTPFQNRIMQVFDVHKRSSKAVRSILDNFLAVAEAFGNPNQTNLFGENIEISVESVFEGAVKSYEQNVIATDAAQVGLFDQDQGRVERRKTGDQDDDSASQTRQTKKLVSLKKFPDQLKKITAEEYGRQSELRNTEDLSEIFPAVTSSVEGDAINLSPEAMEIILSARDLYSATDEPITSAEFMTAEQVRDITAKLSGFIKEAQSLGYTEQELSGVYDLIGNFQEAAKVNGTVIPYVHAESLAHERFHQSGYRGSRTGTIETRIADLDAFILDHRDVINKAKTTLFNRFEYYRNAPDAVIVEEMATYIGTGEYDTLGLTEAEAQDYIYDWFSAYAAQNGAESLDNFNEIVAQFEETADTIERLRNETNRRAERNAQKESSSIPESAEQSQSERSSKTGGVREEIQDEQPSAQKFAPGGREKVSGAAKNSDIPLSDRTYISVTNEAQKAFADLQLDKGVERAEQWFTDQINDKNLNSGATNAVGASLMQTYAKQGDIEALNRIADKLIPSVTEAAQAVQAMAILSVYKPDQAAAYAAKIKKQRTGKDLTEEEAEKATQIARDISEIAQAEGVSQALLDEAKNKLKELDSERKSLQSALKSADSKSEKLSLDLSSARKDISSLKAKIKRLLDKRPAKAKQTTQPALLRELKAKESDLLARIKQSFADFDLKKVGELLAPNGKFSNLSPAQHKQVRTQEFKKWFGDWENDPANASKVIDENGEPRIVYHGTSANFDTFSFESTRNDAGIYFTTNPGYASGYASNFRDAITEQNTGSNIVPVFLNIRTPLFNQKRNYSENGKEFNRNFKVGDESGKLLPGGIGFASVRGFDGFIESNEIIAFKPTQIKSAIGNSGEFDTNNPSILKKVSDTTKPDLVDWATLTLLENLPKGKISVDEFYRALNVLTKNKLTEEEAKDIHAEAVERIKNSKPLTADQKAASKLRNEHYREAESHVARFKREAERLAKEWNKSPKTETPDSLASAIISEGVSFDAESTPVYSDEALYHALVRRGLTPAEAETRLLKEFPDLTRIQVRRAIVQGNDITEKAKNNLKRKYFQAKNQYSLTEREIAHLEEARKFNTREKNMATRRANQFYDSLAKSNVEIAAQTITNIRRAGLLTGVRTHLQNVASNIVFAASEEVARAVASIADIAASKVTGERTVQGVSPEAIIKSLASVVRQDETLKNSDRDSGLRKALNIMTGKDIDADEISKLQLHESNLSDSFKGGGIIDAYVNTVFRSLTAEDALFKAYAFRRSIAEQAKTTAKDADERRKLEAAPTAAMQANAVYDAEFATFQNDNAISDKFRQFKNLDPRLKFLTEIAVPFDRTPTNIVYRVLEYSPLGFIKAGNDLRKMRRGDERGELKFRNRMRGAIEQDISRQYESASPAEKRELLDEALTKAFSREQQQQFARTFGRAGVGSFGLVIGFSLASAGLLAGSMSPEDDDREETSEFFERRKIGIENRSLLLPGIGRFVLPQDPFFKIVASGATLWEQGKMAERKRKGIVGASMDAASETAKDIVFEQPLMGAFKDVFEGKSKVLGERAGSLAGSFVPTLLADAGEVGDEKARKASGYSAKQQKGKSWADVQAKGFQNTFARRVPILRNYAAEESKSGVSPKERGGALRRLVRAVDPFNTRSPRTYKKFRK